MKKSAITNIFLLGLFLLLPSAASAGQCSFDKTSCDTTVTWMNECTTAADCTAAATPTPLAPKPEPTPTAPPTATGGAVAVPMPLGRINLAQAIGRTIRVILGMTGSMALVMFIYGGFLYMTAAGDDDKVTLGKKTIIWAILGLVTVFSAYAVVDFVIKGLTEVKVESPASASKLGGPDDK